MVKNFTTIFPSAQNVHLIKDVGQIGNFLAAIKKYKATLVCYKNSKDYSFLMSEADNLTIDFIEQSGKKLFLENAVIEYIKTRAKSIDIIHFFHLTKESMYYALLYKTYNSKGKIYIKMDVYNDMLLRGIFYSKKPLFNWVHKRIEKLFFKKINLISAENLLSVQLLKDKYPMLESKTILVTNGVNDQYLKTHFPTIKSNSEKEKIILSVGRIGAKEKNYEMLLRCFSKCNLKDWKLYLVGPIENNFEKQIENAIQENPDLKNRVILTGSIEDRVELYNYYNRSKIFCLTSPFESFGIAFIEAMYFGNFIIGTSGMSSFDFISKNQKLGVKVDVNQDHNLVNSFNSWGKNEVALDEINISAPLRVAKHFYWSEIIKILDKEIYS